MLASANIDMAKLQPFDRMWFGNISPRYAHSGPVSVKPRPLGHEEFAVLTI